jgi:hypothetical protein
MIPDLCYVENTTDEHYTLKYEFQPYEFPPGEKRLAPRVAVNAWFGDPDLADHPTDPRRKSRTDAARKIACRWGIFRDQAWEVNGVSRFPVGLKCFDFEGNFLPTIHQDPTGKTLVPPDSGELEQANIMAQMQQMQRALAQLQAQAAEQGVDLAQSVDPSPAPIEVEKPEASDPDGGAVPDSSSVPKAKKAGARKVAAVKP